MGVTSIEWTDKSWSPIRVRIRSDARKIAIDKGYTSLIPITEQMVDRVGPHCERVSPGCENCYAATNNRRRLPSNGTGLPYDRRSRDLVEAFVDERILLQPLKWKEPQRIFVENQSDLFGEWVTDDMRDQVFAVSALTPQHTYQVLTKRPEQMSDYVDGRSEPGCDGMRGALIEGMTQHLYSKLHPEDKSDIAMWLSVPWPLPNVHLGVSCEDQDAAYKRIPLLLQAPAAVRFISAEPLLGPIDFGAIPALNAETLDWVIVGGESGPGARPMHPNWARSLRDQCVAAGVPFFFKQWGEYAPFGTLPSTSKLKGYTWDDGNSWTSVAKVGKKRAGAMLDGREWREFPA